MRARTVALLTGVAAGIPGTVPSSVIARCRNCSCCARGPSLPCGSDSSMRTRASEAYPLSIDCRCTSVRTSRPAAATMATASDTCRTTSARRVRRPGPPSEPRPPLRSGAATSPLASSQAGTRPATAAARPMPAVTVATTTPSMLMDSTRGSPSGRLATSARNVHQANAKPSGPGGQRQEHALCQDVRNDPAARRAERGPHRELLPAGSRHAAVRDWPHWRSRSAARGRPPSSTRR